MPHVNILTDTVSTGIVADLGGDTQAYGYLAENTLALSYSSAVFSGYGLQQSVTIAGTASSVTSQAVSLSGNDTTLTITATGTVTNSDIHYFSAVQMFGENSNITNFGTISGATGVRFTPQGEGGGRLTNHGIISGNGAGFSDSLSLEQYGSGVEIDSGEYDNESFSRPIHIVNTGTISGSFYDGSSPGFSIQLVSYVTGGFPSQSRSDFSNTAVHITNTGTLVGTVRVLSQSDTIINSGHIHGDVSTGAGGDVIDNRGGQVHGRMILGNGQDVVYGSSQTDIVYADNDEDRVIAFDGDDEIYGSYGEDDLRGGGGADEIYGGFDDDDLHGGSGNDILYGGQGEDVIDGVSGHDTIFGGSEADVIDGGSGNDRITGGTGADDLDGGTGLDFLRGEEGDDKVDGGASEDTLSGGAGNDNMFGGTGADRVFGGGDNDTIDGGLDDDFLSGGVGNDTIFGGGGDDTLTGDGGQDTLTGGPGSDIFVFDSVSDSPHGASRDTITDFEAGVDQIDLSGLLAGLSFVGGYTGTAGEVRYNAGVGRLYVDIDGDMSSDFSINLLGNPALTATDLIL